MKSIVFDAGPIISLATNNLLWLLEKTKERYGGEYLIPAEVELELVTRPIESKKFKLEALQVNREINKGVIRVIDDEKIHIVKRELLMLANSCFIAKGIPMKIVHDGEMAALAAAILYEADAMVVDERTTRELIEDPERLASIMGKHLHTSIQINRKVLEQFKSRTRGIKLIRSVELAMMGYELGWFDKYLTQDKGARKTLIEAILWGIKIRGASISQREIDKIVNIEK